MSAASASPPGVAGSAEQRPAQPAAPTEACPLCRSPLHPEQEWCLHCGAAARTRLAASPAWKAPVVSIVVVLVVSLGVLAGSLVKLVGSSGPAATQTTTVTTQAAATAAPLTQTQLPASTATTTIPTTTPSGALPSTTTPVQKTTTGASTTTLPKTPSSQLTKVKRGLPRLKQQVEERLRTLGLLPHSKK